MAHKNKKNNGNKNAHHYHNVGRNAYEAKVINESLQRAGNNPQLKGIIHEVLIKDSINANPINIAKGVSASLTKSPNAKTVDIVVSKGGKVIQRIQAKDTLQSVQKTINRIRSGYYNSSRIVATHETAQKLTEQVLKHGVKKSIQSSGISTNTTKALASKAGVLGTTGLSKACLAAAKSNAVTGAVVGTGFAVVQGLVDLIDDEKDAGEVVLDIGRESAGCALSAAGAGAAATAAGSAVAAGAATLGLTGLAVTTMTVAAPIGAAILVGSVIKSLWDDIFD